MLQANLGSYPEANRALLGEFKTQEDVKIYSRLPDYDDFRGFDLYTEIELSAISERILKGHPKTSWSPSI